MLYVATAACWVIYHHHCRTPTYLSCYRTEITPVYIIDIQADVGMLAHCVIERGGSTGSTIETTAVSPCRPLGGEILEFHRIKFQTQ